MQKKLNGALSLYHKKPNGNGIKRVLAVGSHNLKMDSHKFNCLLKSYMSKLGFLRTHRKRMKSFFRWARNEKFEATCF
jgi:hypothetical protein